MSQICHEQFHCSGFVILCVWILKMHHYVTFFLAVCSVYVNRQHLRTLLLGTLEKASVCQWEEQHHPALP